MKLYFPDEVQITPASRDANFRNEVKGHAFSVDAYVENDDKIVYGSDGIPINPAKRVFLHYNVSIKAGDYIKVLKRSGFTVEGMDQLVRSVSRVGTFSRSHLEVLV